MTEQTTAAPAPDDAVTAALPPLPQDLADDGYDWMDMLDGAWWPLAGFMGRMIGDWPYVCVALHTDRDNGRYGLAVYKEGTVTATGYADEKARNAAALTYCA